MPPGRRFGLGGTCAPPHAPHLSTFVTGLPAMAAEAEDLSQEVFLRVYRTLGSYRSAYGGFATWMTSVTRNLLIDHYRRTKRDRMTDSLDDAMPVVENKESAARRPGRTGAAGRAELASADGADQAFAGIARGGDFARFAAAGVQRDSTQVLAVPEGTVKSRINRGRIELARILQQMGVRPS